MRQLVVAFALAISVLAAQGASAAIILNFGTEFSGSGGTLSGDVVVTIDDGGSAGTVDVTIDATDLDGALSEYISGLYLNLNPVLDPTALSFAFDGGAIDPDSVALGADAFQADGDGLYDILVSYPNTDFTAGLTDMFTISLAGLVEEDFDYLSAPAGGSGPFVAALRARSLGADGENSGWFFPERGPDIDRLPEPSTVFLLGLGLVTAGLFRRRASK